MSVSVGVSVGVSESVSESVSENVSECDFVASVSCVNSLGLGR